MAYRILLVDDDPALLRMLGLALHRAGYEVVGALNGPEALEKAQQALPDLVILDIMMPYMDGFEVCRRLRALPNGERIIIVMLSVLDRVESKLDGFSAGADDYLVKPVTVEEMLARVQVLLARRGQIAEAKQRVQARTVAWIGAKGGVGTTTLAVNMALIGAQDDRHTILIDLHPQGGMVAEQLGVTVHQSLGDIGQQAVEALDSRMLRRYLITYNNRLRILAAPPVPQRAENTLSPQHVRALLDHLATRADLLVVDLPARLCPMTQTVLERTDRIVLVTEADKLAIGAAGRWLQMLAAHGITGDVVEVVAVNRIGGATSHNKTELEQMLGTSIRALISYAADACLFALKTSTPIVQQQRGALVEQQIRELAQQLL